MLSKILCLLTVLIAFVFCIANPAYADSNPVNSLCIVNIYRIPTMLKSLPIIISVSDKETCELSTGQYIRVSHTPGLLTVRAWLSEQKVPEVLSCIAISGKDLYLQIRTISKNSVSIQLVPSYLGKAEISKCKILKELSITTLVPSAFESIQNSNETKLNEDSTKPSSGEPPTSADSKASLQKKKTSSSISEEVPSQANMSVITILDFKIENMSRSDANLIQDLLFHALVKQRKYKVIDKDKRNEILQEIEFSQSDCSDEKCLLQLGMLLSSDLIIVGSIGQISNRFLLNTKLLKVETSEVLTTSSEIYKNLDELVDNCQDVISELTKSPK